VRTGPPIDTTTPTRVQGMAIDADGKLLFADPANNVVEQVDPVPDVPLPGYCRLLPFTSADAFVFRQLDDFDAPIPLQSQLDVIERQLLSGAVTPEQMIDFYAHGAAWSTKVGALSRLYAAYFKRVPDTGGLAGWKARLDSGAALRVVSDAFAASPEFRQTYGRLANGAFVDLVYRNVLGRAPDAAGRRHWLGYLSRGYSRGWLMLQFSESREFKLRSASRTDAVLLRYGMLRQAPTQAQSDLWARRVAAGTLDTTLIGEIYDSAAYAARVVPRPPR